MADPSHMASIASNVHRIVTLLPAPESLFLRFRYTNPNDAAIFGNGHRNPYDSDGRGRNGLLRGGHRGGAGMSPRAARDAGGIRAQCEHSQIPKGRRSGNDRGISQPLPAG